MDLSKGFSSIEFSNIWKDDNKVVAIPHILAAKAQNHIINKFIDFKHIYIGESSTYGGTLRNPIMICIFHNMGSVLFKLPRHKDTHLTI